MKKSYSLAAFFGEELAEMLSAKLRIVYPSFDSRAFQKSIAKQLNDKSYTQRVSLFADELKRFLP